MPREQVPPPSINPHLKARRVKNPLEGQQTAATLTAGIRNGNTTALGKAITFIESTQAAHQEVAQAIISACLPKAGQSFRIGITGSPGVGKSTFVETFGMYLIGQGHRVAVLAIDPSSSRTKGSILGDKTRMNELAAHPNAFIRPSPAGTSLGGVARKTREAIILCEAAGYDQILIETVGVGQSETAVHSMVDCFALLLLPGAGDELQGIKRGIVEMADLLLINKAEDERLNLAKQTKRNYRNALHLYPLKPSQWSPQIFTCSALKGEGIKEIYQGFQDYRKHIQENGFFQENRQAQAHYWLFEAIRNELEQTFFQHPAIHNSLPEVQEKVRSGEWTSFQGAQFLLDQFRENSKK